MSLNILQPATVAVHELRGNHHFENLIGELGGLSQKLMISALSADPHLRADQTAYARAVYDVWEALHSAYTGQKLSQVKPEPLGKRSKTDVG